MSVGEQATVAPLWTRQTWPFIVSLLALMTFIAFESFAIATVLPAATASLEGTQWYALSYAGTVTTALVGMVAGGTWADRSGTSPPLKWGGGMFLLGVAFCALAPNIASFIFGRMLQGIGGGINSVVLYVLIAHHVPAGPRPKMFGLLTAAWLLPSMLGPLVAGRMTELASWRTVFGVVLIGSLASLTGLLFATRQPRQYERSPKPPARIVGRQGILTVVAAGTLLLLHFGGRLEMPISALAVTLTLIALGWTAVRILPAGTLSLGGAPQRLVVLRAILGSTVAATDVYLTLYLQNDRGFSPTLAGLVIAIGATGWAAGAWMQGRYGSDPAAHRGLIMFATPLVATGPAAVLLYTLDFAPTAMVVAANVATGAGMGIAYPRISTATLAFAHDREQGKYSSALQAGESMAVAALLAVCGTVLTASEVGRGFPLIYATLTVAAAAATLLSTTVHLPQSLPQSRDLGSPASTS